MYLIFENRKSEYPVHGSLLASVYALLVVVVAVLCGKPTL